VGGEKHPVGYAENTKRSKKSQALGMTKGGAALPLKIGRTDPRSQRETLAPFDFSFWFVVIKTNLREQNWLHQPLPARC
jgi:hypothetical protein